MNICIDSIPMPSSSPSTNSTQIKIIQPQNAPVVHLFNCSPINPDNAGSICSLAYEHICYWGKTDILSAELQSNRDEQSHTLSAFKSSDGFHALVHKVCLNQSINPNPNPNPNPNESVEMKNLRSQQSQ